MEKLGINTGFLLAQIVNFGIVAFVLGLAWNPLVKALEARREKIAKGLEDARVAEQARANAEREAQKLVDQRRAEANKLVEEGRGRGEEQARTVVADAQHEAEDIKTRARRDAEDERNALLGEVRSQVATLAIAAAERVVAQSLDQNKAQAIVADFFSKPQSTASVKNLGSDIEVTSALPLTDAEKQKIAAETGAKNIGYKVDPSILGGLVFRSGETVVDASVKANLQSLAAQVR
jgi:F-type H+-transporting ATPase subunit b